MCASCMFYGCFSSWSSSRRSEDAGQSHTHAEARNRVLLRATLRLRWRNCTSALHYLLFPFHASILHRSQGVQEWRRMRRGKYENREAQKELLVERNVASVSLRSCLGLASVFPRSCLGRQPLTIAQLAKGDCWAVAGPRTSEEIKCTLSKHHHSLQTQPSRRRPQIRRVEYVGRKTHKDA